MADPLLLAGAKAVDFVLGYLCNKCSSFPLHIGGFKNHDVPRALRAVWGDSIRRAVEAYVKSPPHALSSAHEEALRAAANTLAHKQVANELFLDAHAPQGDLRTSPLAALRPDSLADSARFFEHFLRQRVPALGPSFTNIPDSFYLAAGSSLPAFLAFFFVERVIKHDDKARAQIMWKAAQAADGKLDALLEESAKTNRGLATLLAEIRRGNAKTHEGIDELLRLARETDEDRRRRYEAEFRAKVEAEAAAKGAVQSPAEAAKLADAVIAAAEAPGFDERARAEGGPLAVLEALEHASVAHMRAAERELAATVDACFQAAQWAIVIGESQRAARSLDNALRLTNDNASLFILRGRVAATLGNQPAAEAFAREGLNAAERARDERDVSAAYDGIGDSRFAQGDGPGALSAYRAGLKIAEALAARDPANTQWQRDLSVSHNKIGDVLVAQGDGPGALSAYRAGLKIREALAARDPANTEWQRDVAMSFGKLGVLMHMSNDKAGARGRFDAGRAIMFKLSAKDPSNAIWKRDLAQFDEMLRKCSP